MDYDCFLSHNSKDKPAVRDLWARLQAAGLKDWFDGPDHGSGHGHWSCRARDACMPLWSPAVVGTVIDTNCGAKRLIVKAQLEGLS